MLGPRRRCKKQKYCRAATWYQGTIARRRCLRGRLPGYGCRSPRAGMIKRSLRTPPTTFAVDVERRAKDAPEAIRLRAFTAHSIVTGSLDIEAARLTDHLNERDALVLTDVSIIELESSNEQQTTLFVLARKNVL